MAEQNQVPVNTPDPPRTPIRRAHAPACAGNSKVTGPTSSS